MEYNGEKLPTSTDAGISEPSTVPTPRWPQISILTKKDADFSVNFNKSLWFSQNASQFPETSRGLLSKKVYTYFFCKFFIRKPPDVLRKKQLVVLVALPLFRFFQNGPKRWHLRRKWCYTARVPYLLKGRIFFSGFAASSKSDKLTVFRMPNTKVTMEKPTMTEDVSPITKVVAILVYPEDSFTELGSTSNLKLS